MKSYMFRKDSVTSHSIVQEAAKVSGTDQKIFQSVPETFYPVTIHIRDPGLPMRPKMRYFSIPSILFIHSQSSSSVPPH